MRADAMHRPRAVIERAWAASWPDIDATNACAAKRARGSPPDAMLSEGVEDCTVDEPTAQSAPKPANEERPPPNAYQR